MLVTSEYLQAMKTQRLMACRELSQSRIAVVRERLLPAIQRALDPLTVTIFGSLARGTATEDSDADVLVIAGNLVSSQRWLDRQNMAQSVVAAADLPFGCDLLVWTREERDRARATKNGLLAEIEEQGVIIYDPHR
ncbi:MAG: nucleotidyltransferase domain-containing protein [Acidithiobacillus sp.]